MFSKDEEDLRDSIYKNVSFTKLKTAVMPKNGPQLEDDNKDKLQEYQGYIDIIWQLKNSKQSSYGMTNVSDRNEKAINIEMNYMISSEWLSLWIEYVTEKGDEPGPINNINLWNKISEDKHVKRQI